jgi:4a-hydroxytetrahydrobiopterin dehydratase
VSQRTCVLRADSFLTSSNEYQNNLSHNWLMNTESFKTLTDEEIQQRLKELSGWKYADNLLTKEFTFKNFMEAVLFVNSLSPLLEKINHHPDIHIYYNKIIFDLQTHKAGDKVTDLDFTVAEEIERLFSVLVK